MDLAGFVIILITRFKAVNATRLDLGFQGHTVVDANIPQVKE